MVSGRPDSGLVPNNYNTWVTPCFKRSFLADNEELHFVQTDLFTMTDLRKLHAKIDIPNLNGQPEVSSRWAA